MYGYVYADPKVVEKFGDIRFWVPAALINIPSCRPRDFFLFDCYFCVKLRNPYLRVLLIKKVPRNFVIANTPSIDAPRIADIGGCSVHDIIKDLEIVRDELREGRDELLQMLVDSISKPKDLEITFWRWFRRKKYVIPATKLRSISLRIARDSLRSVLKGLCIDINSVSTSIPSIEVKQVYVLLVLSRREALVGIALGKKVDVSSIHTAILTEFQGLLDEVSRIVNAHRL
ncbi:MAG TPA: hypothetical protein EYP48_03200 [Ignisphaera sp.]|uniref:Uncharacterized protein n=1 Tax=Ignisphaera aggregans TaxID=334771 RepID=A0A832Z463_9CREN|nr:hypothetical protein [Ignisphaera sp.]HIP57503.1 hypothetical protein [Ignisphaera aggregans]